MFFESVTSFETLLCCRSKPGSPGYSGDGSYRRMQKCRIYHDFVYERRSPPKSLFDSSLMLDVRFYIRRRWVKYTELVVLCSFLYYACTGRARYAYAPSTSRGRFKTRVVNESMQDSTSWPAVSRGSGAPCACIIDNASALPVSWLYPE
jgi:hypothetical protein